MRFWGLSAVVVLAAVIAGCSGNSTPVGITVTAAGISAGATATVLENQTLQFSAAVTGGGAAEWQICLPASQVNTQPTDCTAIPGYTAVNATVLTGYGTITQTGLYTAPNEIPSPNSFLVMAINSASPTKLGTWGTMNVQVDSGIRVQVTPSTATIASSGTVQFTATVTGSTTTAVTWQVNGLTNGNTTNGTISNSGLYTAPPSVPGAITITAISVADSSKTATASVTVTAPAAPVLTSIDPTQSEQGAAQQDVYITGSNFLSTSQVYVLPPGGSPTPVTTTFISTSLLRATIPGSAMTTAGSLPIEVQDSQTAAISAQVSLNLLPVRPSLIATTPDTVPQSSATTNVNLTGGFFSPGTTSATFNHAAVVPSFTSTRQMSIGIPTVATPGLYPIAVQNTSSGTPVGTASLNLSVSPVTVPTAPISSFAVGSNPSAIAIDYASGTALVVNTGNGTSAGTVSVVNLATTPPTVTNTITVGKAPTSVAIDDMLSPHLALVVNSGDQTVSAINLTTLTVASTVSVAIGPTSGSPANIAPVPYAVGINSLTHRAVIAYQLFNEATVLDLSTGTPQSVGQIGGDTTAPIGTGTSPSIAIDERLNWAVITPGGGGIQTTSMVDLGHAAGIGDPVARAPEVVAVLGLTAVGIALNGETHTALLADPNQSAFTTFRLLDNSVGSIVLTNAGVASTQLGYNAAAADPLTNVAVIVDSNSAVATIVNLESGIELGNVTLAAGPATAVAIDPVSNDALLVSQASSTVSVLSLGPSLTSLNPVQIVETSPSVTFTSATAVQLTITGGTFTGAPVVLLDGTPVPTALVSSRQLTAAVPASMLGSAHRYSIQVQDGANYSNSTGLTVAQAIPVGNGPVGVAVDTDRDLAVVTNSGSDTVSLIALATTTPTGTNQTAFGSVGVIGSPISVGLNPLGVAVLPRFGLALVANNSSNNVSLIDVTQAAPVQTVSGCASGGVCTGQTAVAIDQDNATAVVTNSTSNNSVSNNNSNNVSYMGLTQGTATAAPTVSPSSLVATDLDPVSVAIDPVVNPISPGVGYAAIGTASQASSIELLSMPGGTFEQRILNLQLPTGMIFDSVNQVFLVANSLLNEVLALDPVTFNQSAIRVGINPTALAYDYQNSTLVTVNSASNTISVLDYVCPPPVNGVGGTCPNSQVQTVLGFGGSQQFSVDVDPKLNIAVVADQNNNRVLLLPLPY